jgi:hypothetical protein
MREAPSQRLVLQRIRNRILEYLEWVPEYRLDPHVDLNELMNVWGDYVDDPFVAAEYPAPVFTPAEVAAMSKTHMAWRAFADRTPQTIVDEDAAFALPEWDALVAACIAAAKVLHDRGRLSEDEELVHDA